MKQKNLFNTKQQAVHEHDFSERLSRAKSFDPPLDSTDRKAVFESLVERFEHAAQGFADGFPDGRAHHWKQSVCKRVRIAPHGLPKSFLNGGRERLGQGWIAALIAPHDDRFSNNGADILGAAGAVVEPLLNVS